VFGRFFTNVGKQLSQAAGRQSICSIPLTTYLQIMLLSLGIITKPLWMSTETQTKTQGNSKPAASGVRTVLGCSVLKIFSSKDNFSKEKPITFL